MKGIEKMGNRIKVICINSIALFPEQIIVGKKYLIEKNSICTYNNEDYCNVYDGDRYIGNFNLKYFKEQIEE